jgi:hypothetical protein
MITDASTPNYAAKAATMSDAQIDHQIREMTSLHTLSATRRDAAKMAKINAILAACFGEKSLRSVGQTVATTTDDGSLATAAQRAYIQRLVATDPARSITYTLTDALTKAQASSIITALQTEV